MATTVKVYDASGALLDTFQPYPTALGQFTGGCYTAVGDINGDGVADVITGAGYGGGPHVKVFDGVAIQAGNANPPVLRSFYAYNAGYLGGVHVAAGDVNGDGLIDIVTGTGPTAAPHVKVFSNGNENQIIMSFYAYESTFLGGVDVACGDLGGDGATDEIVCGAGDGGGPKITLWNYLNNPNPDLAVQQLGTIFAFDSSLRHGVNVASGFVTNNRDASNFLYADVIAGSGPSQAPSAVRVFRLLDAVNDSLGNPNWQYVLAGETSPYGAFAGGVSKGG